MDIRLFCNGKDISNYVSTINWSGSIAEVARKLDITMINSTKAGKVNIGNGNKIVFCLGREEVFQGYVFTKAWSQQNTVMNISAYDALIYLQKSNGTYNIKRLSPEGITQKVCSDFNIPVGQLPYSGITISNLFNDISIYKIIMQVWTKAHLRTGKEYMPRMKEGKLHIVTMGSTVVEYDSNYILEVNNSETIENVVNRVKLYDDKGNYVSTIDNSVWVKAFGILQQTYTREKDKNAVLMAKNMLKDKESTMSMESIGNINCLSGNGIKLSVAKGISGLFYIDSDSHTFENGNHKMSLTLNYKNIMDADETLEEKK